MDDRGGSMRVLLVTDDEGYGDDVAAAGDAVGVDVTVLAGDCNLEATARRAGANTVVFDAQDEAGALTGRAGTFAAAHPRTVVGVVATGVDDGWKDDVLVIHRWQCADRLLDRLSTVSSGMKVAHAARSSVGF
jgi:hypothetical protein